MQTGHKTISSIEIDACTQKIFVHVYLGVAATAMSLLHFQSINCISASETSHVHYSKPKRMLVNCRAGRT
jgi:hypothetical protein